MAIQLELVGPDQMLSPLTRNDHLVLFFVEYDRYIVQQHLVLLPDQRRNMPMPIADIIEVDVVILLEVYPLKARAIQFLVPVVEAGVKGIHTKG